MLDGTLEHDVKAGARVGPNAILQLEGPVDAALGQGAMAHLLGRCGVCMPSGAEMIDERDAARVHQALRQWHADQAVDIARAAGIGTAQYICANRIPAPARVLLRLAPTTIGARFLTKAILAHAWTFCGSGTVMARSGSKTIFSIQNNPLLATPYSETPQCDWHVAVFEELYTSLLGRTYKVVETACCAQGAPACTFDVTRV